MDQECWQEQGIRFRCDAGRLTGQPYQAKDIVIPVHPDRVNSLRALFKRLGIREVAWERRNSNTES